MDPFIILLLLVHGIIGTVVGRILYRKRLGASVRYAVSRNNYSGYELFATRDSSSAQTYGLWSILLWPLTIAIWAIQAPTPDEKRTQRIEELKNATEALEAVAKEYDLKVRV